MSDGQPPVDRTQARLLLAGVRDLGRLSAGIVADRFSELVEEAIAPGGTDPELPEALEMGVVGLRLVDAASRWLTATEGGAGAVERLELPPVRPGDWCEATAWIHNDSPGSIARVSVTASVLATGTGEWLAPDAVSIDPEAFALDPGASRSLRVRVDVPAGSIPGRYQGLLLSSVPAGEPIVIAVDVRGDP